VLAELGVRTTAAGAATISAEIEAADFERLFGRIPAQPTSPGNNDALGFASQGEAAELPVPERLRDYVATSPWRRSTSEWPSQIEPEREEK
jgi:hypothetical protein